MPSQERGPVTHLNNVNKPLIGTLSLSADDPIAVAALACVSKYLPLLKVQSTISASQQMISGVTVTLRCQIICEEDKELWQFTVNRKAGNKWHLKAAHYLKNVP